MEHPEPIECSRKNISSRTLAQHPGNQFFPDASPLIFRNDRNIINVEEHSADETAEAGRFQIIIDMFIDDDPDPQMNPMTLSSSLAMKQSASGFFISQAKSDATFSAGQNSTSETVLPSAAHDGQNGPVSENGNIFPHSERGQRYPSFHGAPPNAC